MRRSYSKSSLCDGIELALLVDFLLLPYWQLSVAGQTPA